MGRVSSWVTLQRETGTRVRLHDSCFKYWVKIVRTLDIHVRLHGSAYLATATVEGKQKNARCPVCHCLEAWDWWSGRGDAKYEESFSTRRDGHSAELAGATTNSDGKRRTIGYRRRYDVQLSPAWWRQVSATTPKKLLWLWADTLHGDRESCRPCDHGRHRPATGDSDSL